MTIGSRLLPADPALAPAPDAAAPPAGVPGIARLVLLGHPVAHSLSPHFQNAGLRAAGIPLVYSALDVAPDALDATLAALAAEGAAGNVTLPHKEAVAARCHRLTATAARVGAVNTFWHAPDGTRTGDNTDVGGFAAAARALLGREPRDLAVALLGAGGSAAAVIAAVERWPGCRVRLWARTSARADALAARFPGLVDVQRSPDACVHGATLVVNATPLGLAADDPFPIAPEGLAPGTAVLDLVYRAGGTAWVRACAAAGLRATDGLAMLVEQGALAFERWFGRAPDRRAMWDALADRAGDARG